MAGYSLASGRFVGSFFDNFSVKISQLVGINRCCVLIIVPEPGSLIYVGPQGINATNGFLIPPVGKTFIKETYNDKYNLDEIYINASFGSDIAYITAIEEGGAAAVIPAEEFFLLTEDGDFFITEDGDNLVQEAAP